MFDNQVKKTTTKSSSSTTFSVVGTGNSVGVEDPDPDVRNFRIWDGAASGNVIVTPTNPWIAPFKYDFLPGLKFNAIVLLTLDGRDTVHGFSNYNGNLYPQYIDSQQNLIREIDLVNQNIYWTNILRCTGGSNLPSNNSYRNYFFGTDSLYYSPTLGSPGALKINLLEPPASPVTFTYTMLIDSFGFTSFTFGSITINPSSNYRDVSLGNFPPGVPAYLPNGQIRIQVNCDNPSYRSLLKYYFWGIADPDDDY